MSEDTIVVGAYFEASNKLQSPMERLQVLIIRHLMRVLLMYLEEQGALGQMKPI